MVRLTIEKPDAPPLVETFDKPVELTIGRSGGCTYCLDFDPMVSRMHAVILIDPPSMRIKDLNSTNGVTINGELFGALGDQKIIQPVELRDGDEIFIGVTRFVVTVTEPGLELAPEVLRMLHPERESLAPANIDVVSKDRLASRFIAAEMAGRKLASSRHEGDEETVPSVTATCPEITGYRADRFIAAGRTGTVYRGTSLETGKEVALKVMSPGSAFSKEMLEEFRSRAEQLGRLQHPNIARLLEAGDMGYTTFFTVTDYINGENLASYLERCPNHRIPVQTAYALVAQLASALCYAHRHGVVHRDVHPGGIMLYDENGRLRVKFTDIGMAGFWAECGLGARSSLSQEEDLSRLGYVAPEELLMLGEAAPSVDVFGLSAVFYHMVAGRVPYSFGEWTNNLRVVEDGRVTPLERVMPDLPAGVIDTINRGLSAEPSERFKDACELQKQLEYLLV